MNVNNNSNTSYLDSACTSHYIKQNTHCINKHTVNDGVTVRLPNGATMQSKATCNLDIKGLTKKGTEANIFDNMHVNLISLGQLCDDDCVITLLKTKALVHKYNNLIMMASRNRQNGMWEFDLNRPQDSMNNVYEITMARDIVTYLHGAAGFPVVDTWVKAIRNNQYATWPGLTSALVYKHLPKSIETAKGHLQHIQQNIRSTKEKTSHMFAMICDVRQEIHTDLTRAFPVVSSRGNR